MDEIHWDIQEVKRLKKKRLIQADLVILLLFILSIYYINVGWPISVFLGLSILILWTVVAHSLYTITTGKVIGGKTSRLLQEFDKQRSGKKHWKRKKTVEAVFITVISAICTALVFNMDPSSESVRFINLWPCIGAWVGSNIGEIFRIANLQ